MSSAWLCTVWMTSLDRNRPGIVDAAQPQIDIDIKFFQNLGAQH